MASDSADFARSFDHLCHLAALSRSGKIEGAIDSLVATSLAMLPLGRGVSAEKVSEEIGREFGLRLSLADVRGATGRLLVAGRIQTAGRAGFFEASPGERAGVQQRALEAARLEADVRDEWLAEVATDASGLSSVREQLWTAARATMAVAFRQHGALTLELLDGDVDNGSGPGMFRMVDQALDQAGLASCPNARAAIEHFFDSQTSLRSRYLSQLLDGTFTFFAITLDRATADYLVQGLKPLDLFLDTNFIFGVLGLHLDYFTDLSRDALDLIQSGGFPFSLYVHPQTLLELDRTIGSIGARLRPHRWTQEVSRIAVEIGTQTGHLSGVELSYHSLNARTPTDPNVYLTRFEHIDVLIKDLGLRLYEEPRNRGYSDQEKWNLIGDYNDFVEKARPGRPKPYEAMDHDMAVWLSIHQLHKQSRSALGAGALLLSNDYLLYRFDWRNLRSEHDSGTVVTPSQLLQVLRPFVPATEEFDKSFAETFAIPHFRTAQSDYGAVTSDVLGFMNSLADLPRATAIRVLTDEVVLSSLSGKTASEPAFRDIIESEIARDNRLLLEEKEALKRQFAEEHARAKELLARADATTQEQAEALRDVKAREGLLVAQSSKTEALLSESAEREASLRDSLGTEQRRRQRLESTVRAAAAVGVWLLGLFVILAAPVVANFGWLLDHHNRVGLDLLAGLVWTGAVWAFCDKSNRVRVTLGVVAIAVVGIATVTGQ